MTYEFENECGCYIIYKAGGEDNYWRHFGSFSMFKGTIALNRGIHHHCYSIKVEKATTKYQPYIKKLGFVGVLHEALP